MLDSEGMGARSAGGNPRLKWSYTPFALVATEALRFQVALCLHPLETSGVSRGAQEEITASLL
jgi:hypothetical protein